MTAAIIDDEPLARRGIHQLLAKHDDIIVVGEADNGRDAATLLAETKPDLVFLDIQMPECDGFDVLQALPPDVHPYVIVVTAYDTFAVRAFEAQALDYLVKPIHEARFEAAVTRARQRRRADAADATRPVVIATNGIDLVVSPDEIVWIEADDYYAAVHALGRRHLVRESLASLHHRLDRRHFVRVHRSAIVNLAHVREVRASGPGDAAVVLRDGTALPLSRRRRDEVTRALRRFAAPPADR
jgi:two-component system, LytTR family, response regulator